jgi:hypothetical protein
VSKGRKTLGLLHPPRLTRAQRKFKIHHTGLEEPLARQRETRLLIDQRTKRFELAPLNREAARLGMSPEPHERSLALT